LFLVSLVTILIGAALIGQVCLDAFFANISSDPRGRGDKI
jgi:hypothetical protein